MKSGGSSRAPFIANDVDVVAEYVAERDNVGGCEVIGVDAVVAVDITDEAFVDVDSDVDIDGSRSISAIRCVGDECSSER